MAEKRSTGDLRSQRERCNEDYMVMRERRDGIDERIRKFSGQQASNDKREA